MKKDSNDNKETLDKVFRRSYPELDKEINDICLEIKYRKKCSKNKIDIQLSFKAFVVVIIVVSVTTLLSFIIYLNMR